MRVHQVCARLQFGDAVTNQVVRIHEILRSWGWESHVYASSNDAVMAPLNEGLKTYRRFMRSKEDILLFHYSVYDDNHRLYLETRNRRVFIYHNITPPELLEPYDAHLAEVCRRGRELLPRLRGCDLALGDSEYNRRELVEAGFEEGRTGVLPIFMDLEKLGGEYNTHLHEELGDGRVNVLFVGRLVPNKKVEDLIDLFAFYHHYINVGSRLFLVGTSWSVDYTEELARRVRAYGLQGRVSIPGGSEGVSEEDLRAYYRSAHLFVTCSLHEGFCVPLLESMFFKVPILARRAAAVPYTLGDAGVTFGRLDVPLLAEVMEEMVTNRPLREALAGRMDRRLREFDAARTEEKLKDYLEALAG
ncbi:glycosyltransferase [Candidatus Solincola sp.]|nr:glycosyltransferase [Actinomycetota bacterium]MDI7252060.1 glycosyltransferase [Actinomycetota bacterium]